MQQHLMILFCLSVSPSSLLINSGEEYFLGVESPSIYEISLESVQSQSRVSQESVKSAKISSILKLAQFANVRLHLLILLDLLLRFLFQNGSMPPNHIFLKEEKFLIDPMVTNLSEESKIKNLVHYSILEKPIIHEICK